MTKVKDREYACLSPDTDDQPDPGLVVYIDPFRIHACMNQGLAGIQPPLAQGK